MPRPLVTVAIRTCVAWFVSPTVVPVTTAWSGPFTTPVIWPVGRAVWATADGASSHSASVIERSERITITCVRG